MTKKTAVGARRILPPKCLAVLLGFAATGLAQGPGRPTAQSASAPSNVSCAAESQRQFDFWLGDWDATDARHPAGAVRVRVQPILDGCVVHEEYSDVNGLRGESFSAYDAGRGLWRQSWVTNQGGSLILEGGWKNGEMMLRGSRYIGSKKTLVRGMWKPVDGGVRETAWESSDGGKSWTTWFDLLFQPHSKGANNDPPPTQDEAAVAELDRRYQAAVEKNDADTMDIILADDFLLVTGRGKRFSKADLLAEARAGQYSYERQDDSEKSVRVYGDTAIVTARLLAKGTNQGKAFEYSLWFTDIYRRFPTGWRYVYAQSSLPLPKAQ